MLVKVLNNFLNRPWWNGKNGKEDGLVVCDQYTRRNWKAARKFNKIQIHFDNDAASIRMFNNCYWPIHALAIKAQKIFGSGRFKCGFVYGALIE